jgi:hypothetical protein
MRSLKFRIGTLSSLIIELIIGFGLIAYQDFFIKILTVYGFATGLVIVVMSLLISYIIVVTTIDDDAKENKTI